MNATQESVVTAEQVKRILDKILLTGITKEQAQNIIKSGILGYFSQVDWNKFDRNLFCFKRKKIVINTTQKSAVTARQAMRILNEILQDGLTEEQAQGIIRSDILRYLPEVDWDKFDRNLFCFENDIPSFWVSEKVDISVDYQKPLIEYWDCFIESIKGNVAAWLDKITFPDLSELGVTTNKYAVIKCRRDMSREWLDKFMAKGGVAHVNYIELLSFYDQAFEIADRYSHLWALDKEARPEYRRKFFPAWDRRRNYLSGGGLIDMFNPQYLNAYFRAEKGTSILVRCVS